MIKENLKKLTVKYNGKVVGYLVEIEPSVIAFQYASSWLIDGFAISPFSLPLSNKIYKEGKYIFEGLYGVFNDSLPDGWGELLIRRMLAKKGLNYDNLSPLHKLALINLNGLGALEYEPSEGLKEEIVDFSLDELAMQANKIINGTETKVDLDKLYKLGGASGGTRPKVHLKIDNVEWIIKFKSSIDPKDIWKEEFKANELTFKCGLNVNEFKLFPSQICSGYFGAKRFDRNNNKKIHTISLAGILETSHNFFNLDYIHLFSVINQISINKQEDLLEAFKRMCFNVFYKNKDDHSKNFSFIYDEIKHGYVLSPAYDLTTTPYHLEHLMTINDKGNPTENDLLVVAKKFELPIQECQDIIKKIKTIIKENI